MIEENLKKWHAHIRGELAGGLDELLADDVVFFSPVVLYFMPRRDLQFLRIPAHRLRS